MNLQKMKLNETLEIDDFNRILRVPGGWIYSQDWNISEPNAMTTSVFVPFSDEFNENPDSSLDKQFKESNDLLESLSVS